MHLAKHKQLPTVHKLAMENVTWQKQGEKVWASKWACNSVMLTASTTTDSVKNKPVLTMNAKVPVASVIVWHPDVIADSTDHCQRDYNYKQHQNLQTHTRDKTNRLCSNNTTFCIRPMLHLATTQTNTSEQTITENTVTSQPLLLGNTSNFVNIPKFLSTITHIHFSASHSS